MMAIPMLLQRALVWVRTRFADKSEVGGISVAGHPDFPTDELSSRIEDALGRIAAVDREQHAEVLKNIRVIIITEKLKNVL